MPAMTAANLPAIVDCGHAPQPTFYAAGSTVTVGTDRIVMTGAEVMFPGYATTADDRRICPDCADAEQRAAMAATATGDRFTAYLSIDGRTITTWTGGRLATVTNLSRNDRQTFVSATGPEGSRWTGIGPAETGTYVTLRRLRAAA